MRGTRSIGVVVALLAAAAVWGGAASARAGGVLIYSTGPVAYPVADVTPEILGAAADLLIQDVMAAEGVDVSKEDPAEVAGFRTGVLADLTEQFVGMQLGYMCEHFGLFFANMAWWDCVPVFYKMTGAEEITYLPADEAQAKKEAAEEISDPEEQVFAVQQVMSVVRAFEAKAGGKKLAEAYPLSAAKMGFWAKNGRWVLGGILLLAIAFFVWKAVSKKKGAATPAAPANYPPVPGGGGYPPVPGGGGYPPVPGGPPTNVPPQG